jgi:hypothetical protein
VINFEIRDFPPIPSDVTLATDPHQPCVMKPIIGLSVAGLLVLMQLAGLATLRIKVYPAHTRTVFNP